uniref:MATH domain-containing protein n=1 Tax=Ananas comosus var. bracteatus TaxID=296719 RepID=A0A6V7P5P3_ANACO|nr:unnamed protein product [Ananas comosus var. bracteatus]
MEKVTGTHLFKIADYSLAKGIGAGNPISSATFDAGGFDWAIAFYPDGQDKASANHISLFLCLRSDAGNGVKAAFSLTLLDQRRPPPRQPGRRAILLALHCVRPEEASIRNTAQCSPVSLPPSDLHRHLRELLESGDETDVTFEVCGETFPRTGCCSPLGRRCSGQSSSAHEGEEREAHKDRRYGDSRLQGSAALHLFGFAASGVGGAGEGASASMFQHLLAAADRYGLERLRLISEDRLCRNITVSTAATTLVLAEQHHCSRLKEACLEFLASPKSLIDVMKTDGFEHLKISCPSVVKELVDNVN